MKENAEKYRELDATELGQKLQEGAEQTFRLRFQMSMGQTDGVKKVRFLRKERARILTVMRERGETAPVITAPVAASKGKKKTTKKKKA
jgi:large subunit ribosomal protein L29